MEPHFSTVEGDYIKLKIDNNFMGNKLYEKESYVIEVNENLTLWKLKEKLAAIYNESIYQIDVVKYINPLDDSNLGKSLQELHFFNELTIKIQRK